MKTVEYLAMRARKRAERHERFSSYRSADIPLMTDLELGEYIDWLGREMLTATGARYAHLDLLQDMALEERSTH